MWSKALAIGLVVAAAPGADDDGELRVLFPKDGATIPAGESDLICVLPDDSKPPRLKVDGKRVKWEPYARPVLAAKLTLAPGEHEIAIGETKLAVMAEAEREEGFRSHAASQGWKRCADCHEVEKRAGAAVIGDIEQPDACLGCHTAEEFELAHFHPLDPIAACSECHALHGHEAKALLKKPARELCAACHE